LPYRKKAISYQSVQLNAYENQKTPMRIKNPIQTAFSPSQRPQTHPAKSKFLAILCFAGVAQADVVQIDFNGLATASIVDQTAVGTGLTGAWTDGTGSVVESGDLVAPAGTNFGLTQSGDGKVFQGDGLTNSHVGFAGDLGGAGSTVWGSFLCSHSSGGAAAIGFDSNFATHEQAFGNDGGNSRLNIWKSGGSTVGTVGDFQAGTNLVLFKITPDNSGKNDLLEVWTNPDVTAPLGTAYLIEAGKNILGGNVLSSMKIFGLDSNQTIDLITVSDGPNAYADVTGHAQPLESFNLEITANTSTPGNYDFEWDSEVDKVYNLVSNTSLATAPSGWSVWDNQADITSGGTTTSLPNIPGGGYPARFFVVVEKEPLKIMPLGDSITEGLVYQPLGMIPGGYRTRLYNLLKQEIGGFDFVGTSQGNPDPDNLPDPDHEGKGGAQIHQKSVLIENRLAQTNPDMVLLHMGTNDVVQNHDLQNAPQRLDNLISQITSYSPEIYVIVAQIITSTNTRNAAQITTFNAAIPAVVAAHVALDHNVYMVDMNSAVPLDQMNDPYHPTKIGYDAMADRWFDAIMQLPIIKE
jgi:lysophospholipase L1-like esterase